MIDEKTIADLKAKHGDVHSLSFEGHSIVVKKPSRADWKRFKTLGGDPDKRATALEQLVFACTVYPDRAGLDEMFNDLPALDVQFGSELVRLAGGKGDADAKKL